MKGFSVTELGALAVAIVVISVMIGIGSQILSSLQETQCDYTWGSYPSSNITDPSTGGTTGCCQTVGQNTSGGPNPYPYCIAFASGDYGYNATGLGNESMGTFANWIPLIALVIVAAVVIGIIVRYLGGMGATRTEV